MVQVLEDAHKLAHGTYDDVIVAEHRKHATSQAPHVVLEMPEGSRVIDTSSQYEIDGVLGSTAPTVGTSYRVTVGPATSQPGATTAPASALRYETMNR